jgi:vacuolar-type H+-ATPase subunit E/Vma4
VKAFNRASESYRSCIHAYVDNASREVKRIQDQANADIKQITNSSNAAMDTIQAKIKRAVIELNDLAAQESSPQ